MFGYQFCSIPCIKPNNKAAMMIWSLCSIMSSVKALWHEVDSMAVPYLHDGWEGHLLTFIQSKVFSFQTIQVDNKSPFKNHRADSTLIDIIDDFNLSTSNINENMTEPSMFYEFSYEFMCKLFLPSLHPSIKVSESIIDILSNVESSYARINIFIIVGSGIPNEFGNNQDSNPDKIVLRNGSKYELQSMVILRADPNNVRNCNTFDSIRYMRHGGFYKNWWKQERSNKFVTRCKHNRLSEIFFDMEHDESNSSHFVQHILIYVKEENTDVDQWKLKILKSMGGKTHVQCECNDFNHLFVVIVVVHYEYARVVTQCCQLISLPQLI